MSHRIHITSLLALVVLALLVPASASATTQSFTNSTKIAVPATGTSGPASPFPSSVVVGGMTGPVSDVKVTLHGVTHTRPSDLRVLLVAPNGRAMMLMADNCGEGDIDNFSWILEKQEARGMTTGGPCPEFFYHPDAGTVGSLAAPAPPAPYALSLDSFNGTVPNGDWRLFVQDGRDGDVGELKRGWSLTLTTDPVAASIPGSGTQGIADPYPQTLAVAGRSGIITDLNVNLPRVWHQRPSDLEFLLVGPGGQKVLLMSDACGTSVLEDVSLGWDDEADAQMPESGACTGRYRPTDFNPGDTLPGDDTGGPYASLLSAFDGTDPNGRWRLYALDDEAGMTGFLTDPFRLELTTRERARVAFAESATTVGEGGRRELTLRRSASSALLAGSVQVTSTPGSAGAGDFTPVSQTVRFAAGEREKRVTVDARRDGAREGEESYAVSIGSPTGDAEAGAPARATVTIPGSATRAAAGGGAAPRCAGRRATIVGTRGRDRIRGTRRRDVIVAGGGNDVIRAGRGNDLVCAGAGKDRVSGGPGRDRLFGGSGNDRIKGDGGRDFCRGDRGRDRVGCERGR